MNRTLIWNLFLAVAFSPCVTAQVPEENAARTAEQSGRFGEALAQYRAALQKAAPGSADEQRIREAVINVANRITPRPAVPEEARSHMIRGRAAFRLAQSPAEMKDAIDEFSRATNAAPWVSETYFNLALAQEKGEQLPAAIRSYQFYLATQPPETEAAQVRDKLTELRYLEERTQKQQVAKTQQGSNRQAVSEELSGLWQSENARFQTTVTGNSIAIVQTSAFHPPTRRWVSQAGLRFDGQLQGLSINGTVEYDHRSWRNGQVFSRSMKGTVDADGKRIRLDFVSVYAAGASGGIANWAEGAGTLVLVRQQ